MNPETKRAQSMAVSWTITTVLLAGSLVIAYWNILQVVLAVVAGLDAAIWWKRYLDKRNEDRSGK